MKMNNLMEARAHLAHVIKIDGTHKMSRVALDMIRTSIAIEARDEVRLRVCVGVGVCVFVIVCLCLLVCVLFCVCVCNVCLLFVYVVCVCINVHLPLSCLALFCTIEESRKTLTSPPHVTCNYTAL